MEAAQCSSIQEPGGFFFIRRLSIAGGHTTGKTAKCLFWNSVGLCLVHQRMEKARVMSFEGLPAVKEVSAHDFTLILGGAKVTLTVSIKPLE
jgi:hypothetical protein